MYIDIGGFTMKEESRKYVQEAWDIVKDAENMGSRLPGSEGERKYADYMGKKLEEIGIHNEFEKELKIIAEYLAAPQIQDKTLLLVDPMLATGMSMEIAYKALLAHGTPKNTHICCTIGTPNAIAYLEENMPQDCILWCAAIDPILNEKKYIVPGLGDAGDLCFGEKL